jgi:hypothetical protein
MTDYNLVAQQLTSILGCDEEKTQGYENQINSSIEYINSILANSENENDVRIVNLCAVNTAVKIKLAENFSDESVMSFSAGDVSFSKDTSSFDNLSQLLKIAYIECKSLICDNGFSFKAV